MSLVPPLPLLAASMVFEGPSRIVASLSTSVSLAAVPAWLGLAYTVVVATAVGSGAWVWLMGRYPAGVVAPFSMLVPVVGIATAALMLGERPTPLELLGAVLVVGGVVWGSRRAGSMPQPSPVNGVPCERRDERSDMPARVGVSLRSWLH